MALDPKKDLVPKECLRWLYCLILAPPSQGLPQCAGSLGFPMCGVDGLRATPTRPEGLVPQGGLWAPWGVPPGSARRALALQKRPQIHNFVRFPPGAPSSPIMCVSDMCVPLRGDGFEMCLRCVLSTCGVFSLFCLNALWT